MRHRFDEALSAEETLSVVDKPTGLPLTYTGGRFARTLGVQPVGRSPREAPRVYFRLVDLDVDVRETSEDRGVLRVTETLHVERSLSTLGFRFDDEVYLGNRFRRVKLLGVTDAEGHPMAFLVVHRTLVVFPDKVLAAGSDATLKLEYEAPYFDRAGGDNLWELPIDLSWYPRPFAANATMHTVHSVVRARMPFLPFATGETVRRTEDGDFNLVEARCTRSVPYATVLAVKYTIQESTVDGVTCRVASYGIPEEASGKKILSVFHGVRAFYTALLGSFPWKEYTIVEINDYGFGQAPPGMMRIAKEAFQTSVMSDDVARVFSKGVNHRLAHEIAHVYFGDVLTPAAPEHQWIDESFAEILAAYALENLKSRGDAEGLAAVWKRGAKQSTKLAPVFYANRLASKLSVLGDEEVPQARADLIFGKGALLFFTMRKELGDDTFFTVLRSFVKNFEKKRTVTTDDFVSLLSFVTKNDWRPWFQKNFYGFEMP